MRPWVFVFAGLLAGSPLGAADAAPGEKPPLKLYLLDSQGMTVSAIDPANGTAVGKAVVEGGPFALVQSPSVARLIVLDRGPGRDAGEQGYKAKAKSIATVIDTDTFGVVAQADLGWGLQLAPAPLWSADGRRLTVFCPGYDSNKSAEALPRELVNLDVVGAKESGRLTLPRPVSRWVASADGKTVYALSPRVEPKKAPPQGAELHVIDPAIPSLAVSIPLEGAPDQIALSPDGAYLYLLDPGKPSRKAEKNVNGQLQIVSVAGRKIEKSVDAGTRPAGFVLDEARARVLLLSDGPITKDVENPEGELRVIAGAEVTGPIAVAPWPVFLRTSPDSQRLYVVGANTITKIGQADLKAQGTIPFEGPGINWGSSEGAGPVRELDFTSDGKRGLLLYENSSKLLVLDLDAGTTLGSVTTGRGGKKFLKVLGAVAMNAGSYYSSQQQARSSRSSTFTYTTYGVGVANTGLVVRPDGKFAYVLNTQTNDVTIVDTETVQSVQKIAAGGFELRMLEGGALLVVGASAVHVIDTATNTKREEIPVDDVRFVEVSSDRKSLAVLGKKAVLILNGSTGAQMSRPEGFKDTSDMVFEVAPTPPPTPDPTPTPTATPTPAKRRPPVRRKTPAKPS